MEKLTQREFDVYMFIVEYHDKNGYSPSMREICRGNYLSSTNSAAYYVERLIQKGYIQYTPKIPRSIVIKQGSPS